MYMKESDTMKKEFLVQSIDVGEVNGPEGGPVQVIGKFKTFAEAKEAMINEAEDFWADLEENFGDACYRIDDEDVITMRSDDGQYGAEVVILELPA